MPRVVLDTNIYVSAVLVGGNPERIIGLSKIGKVDIFISKPILFELERVLRIKLNRPDSQVKQALLEIQALTRLVIPKTKMSIIKEDEPDNRILECAIECEANFIVTGDKHLLKLKNYKGIKILKPKEFIDLILAR